METRSRKKERIDTKETAIASNRDRNEKNSEYAVKEKKEKSIVVPQSHSRGCSDVVVVRSGKSKTQTEKSVISRIE